MANHDKSAYRINVSKLARRLRSLYAHWQEHKDELWGSCNSFAVATHPLCDELRYSKSSAFSLWLLGYEFPKTILVFSKKQIHFLCSPKKASIVLDAIRRFPKDAIGVDIVMHVKLNYDDGSHQMDSILHTVRSQETSNGSHDDSRIFGIIAREAPEGELLEKWAEKLKSSGLQLCDITNGLADLFVVKGADELTHVKNAAHITAYAMKNFVVPNLETVIDEERKVTHSSLTHDTAKAILEPATIKVNLGSDKVDICYPPIFQSGGNFDLSPSASSNDDHLYYDSGTVIICALGARYNCYCSNVARTFLIDPNAKQMKVYQVLLKAHKAAIGALRPGHKACDVYKAAYSMVLKEAPELAAYLTKSCGTGIGLELRESKLSLTEKNGKILKAGMVLNVSIGLQNLQTKTSKRKSQKYALLLADTVIVTKIGHEVLTSFVSKTLKDVAYIFSDGEEEENERSKVKVEPNLTKDLYSNETFGSSNLLYYENVEDFPPPGREMLIQVDQNNETVLPIYGCIVPIHVTAVKAVSYQPDPSGKCYICIIFDVPITFFASHDPNTSKNQADIFLKEASFRFKDSRHVSEVVQQMKDLRRDKRASFITQQKHVGARNSCRPIQLTNILIQRPFTGHGPRFQGILNAYDNGLIRYSTSSSDECLKILFDNIKQAYFQAAKIKMIASLHLQLHNDIMVGNKNTNDVELYVDVKDVVQTLGGGKGSANDPDEIEEEEEEERERGHRNKTNMSFQSFLLKQVNYRWGPTKVKGFDQILNEPGCQGVFWAIIFSMFISLFRVLFFYDWNLWL